MKGILDIKSRVRAAIRFTGRLGLVLVAIAVAVAALLAGTGVSLGQPEAPGGSASALSVPSAVGTLAFDGDAGSTPVHSYSVGYQADAGQGGAFTSLAITRSVDALTPTLIRYAVEGRHFSGARLVISDPTTGAIAESYALTNVTIANIVQTSGGAGSASMEQVVLTFAGLTPAYG